MTDRGEGASLLPYTPAGVTGSDDDDDEPLDQYTLGLGIGTQMLLELTCYCLNIRQIIDY